MGEWNVPWRRLLGPCGPFGWYNALAVLLGGIKVSLGDLVGAIWANIKKYKELQRQVRIINPGCDFYALAVLLGGVKVPLGDLMGAIWANIKKYKEIQGKLMNKRCRRMVPYPPLGLR